MTFAEIIKTAVLQVINNSRFSDIFIGEVIQEVPVKIKLSEKLFLEDAHIIKTQKISDLSIGKKLVLIRESGGQRYFVIDYIYEEEV